MAHHTPGPWSVFKTFNVMGGSDGRRGVANCGGTVDGRLPDGGEGESRANVALIAAAPDLLDALKAARGALVSLLEDRAVSMDFDASGNSRVLLIDAAIAKASGQSKAGD